MKKIVFLVGPTAVGKTEVSLHLARNIPSEIISADSMQVYRGLNIGTAKPPKAILDEIPHHLIDVLNPEEEFSVFDFREKALQAIDSILEKEKLPLVVGGSGLYIKALMDGLSPKPGEDAEIRKKFMKQAEEKEGEALLAALKIVDPKTADRLKPNDIKRIVRALEVYEVTKIAPSELEENRTSLQELGFEVLLLGIDRDRKELYEKSDRRVDLMMEEGLLEEVKALDYERVSKTAKQAVGYKELFQHLYDGASLEDSLRLLKQNTRHFIKRQFTWFRNQTDVEWFTVTEEKDLATVAEEILTRIKEWISE